MLWWFSQTTLVIAVLVLLVLALTRAGRFSPAAVHALWVVVLLKFLIPPVFTWPWSIPARIAWLDLPRSPGTRTDRTAELRADPAAERATVGSSDADLPIRFDLPHRGEMAGTLDAPARVAHELGAMERFSEPGAVQSPFTPAEDLGSSLATIRVATEPSARWLGGVFRRADMPEWLMLGWLAGALAMAISQARRVLGARRMIAQARSAPAWLVREVACLAEQFGMRPPAIRVVAGLRSPFVWCLGRPELLWPAAAAADRAGARWRSVMAHELAHLKRRDHWVAWLELAATCIWWWNPLFWFVRRRIEEYSELSCDAWAVWAVPDCRRQYVEVLLDVSQSLSRVAVPIPVLGVGTGARRAFQRRLTMILTEQVARRISFRGLVLIVLVGFAAVPSFSRGQQSDQRTPAGQSDQPASVVGSRQPATTDAGGALPAATDTVTTKLRIDVADGAALQGDVVLLQIPNFSKSPLTAAISPDGQRVASSRSEDPAVELRDVSSGALLATATTEHEPIVLTFAPDGETLAAGLADGGILLLHGIQGSVERRLTAHQGPLTVLAFSLDGKLLVSAGRDHAARVWDVISGNELRHEPAAGTVNAAAFSPDGRTLAIATDAAADAGDVRLLPLAGPGSRHLTGHSAPVVSIAFAPDGRSLATASEDRTLRIWDPVSARELASMTLADAPRSLSFSQDGARLVLVSRGWSPFTVQVFGIDENARLTPLKTLQPNMVRPLIGGFALDGRLYVIERSARPMARDGSKSEDSSVVDTPSNALDPMVVSRLGLEMRVPEVHAGLPGTTGVAAGSGSAEIRVFVLRHARAQDVLRIVEDIMQGTVAISYDARTNTVFVRATGDNLKNVTAVIDTLDVSTPKSDEAGDPAGLPAGMPDLTNLPSPRGDSRDELRKSEFDLVSLGTSYLDAFGALQLARQRFERVAQLAENKAVSSEEVATATIQFETAKRKADLLRRVAESALAAAEAEYGRAKRLAQKGFLANSSVAAAEARLKILKTILETAE